MKGIPREVVGHKLNIKSGSKLVKQRLRRFKDEKCKAVGEEIKKSLVQGSSKKYSTPKCLACPVLVKKKNKK
jgi:hypothetical protein